MLRKPKRIRHTNHTPEPQADHAVLASLTNQQQQSLCDLLIRGASPYSACQQLHLSYEAFLQEKNANPTFAAQLAQVQQTLSENITARLYQEALKGNLTAIQFWLKNNPPAQWQQPAPSSDPTPWDHLTHEELQQQTEHFPIPETAQ